MSRKLKRNGKRVCRKQKRRGTMLPMVAVLLPLVLVFAAFSINFTHMELSRTELRIATDAAARAGGRELALTADRDLAIARAREAAARNQVVGEPLLLDDSDLQFGIASRSALNARYLFQPTHDNPNAIFVTGRRTLDSPNGPVQLFMPIAFGAGTFQPRQEAISTQVELDIALILDRSSSMAYGDSEHGSSDKKPASAPDHWSFGDEAPADSRWRTVVEATQVFLDQLQTSAVPVRVSLTTYNQNATGDVALTADYGLVLQTLDEYGESFHGGATNIGEGIEFGVASLSSTGSRPWASKVVILMTDGRHNTGTSPIAAADLVITARAPIFAVTFSQEADVLAMETVASMTGGKHFHAPTRETLIETFRDIGTALPTLLAK